MSGYPRWIRKDHHARRFRQLWKSLHRNTNPSASSLPGSCPVVEDGAESAKRGSGRPLGRRDSSLASAEPEVSKTPTR